MTVDYLCFCEIADFESIIVMTYVEILLKVALNTKYQPINHECIIMSDFIPQNLDVVKYLRQTMTTLLEALSTGTSQTMTLLEALSAGTKSYSFFSSCSTM